VADIAIHFALFLGELLGFSDAYEPQTMAYLQRLKERPGFQRAQQAQAKHAPKK
jgi:glutathione S-transferase